LPSPNTLDVKVYLNWQPVIGRSIGENFDAKDALYALERGVLLIHYGVDVEDGRLADDLKLQELLKPR
jgi:hypothetical protein